MLNLFSILLNLDEKKYNLNLPKFLDNDPINLYKQVSEPDLSYICEKKILEIQYGLKQLHLIPKTKEELLINKEENKNPENVFYLSKSEVQKLMDYIKEFYFPFIRLFYHFCNIDRITENKNIVAIVNKPLPVPPLSAAVMMKLESNLIEDDGVDDNIEEEEEEEEEMENEGQNIQKEMQKIRMQYNINKETEKLVQEKINELNKDFDALVSEKQGDMEKKIEEVKTKKK